MSRQRKMKGFSLIELLLVLAILGTISALAIPTFLRQRQRSREIGDAGANAQVVRMQMEQLRADSGSYGPPTGKVNWDYSVATNSYNVTFSGYTQNPLPGFNPAGNSRMSYNLSVTTNGFGYRFVVFDPAIPGMVPVASFDQNGKI